MKSLYIAVTAVALCLITALTWQRLITNSTPIRIGYIGSLSGKYSDMGKTCRDGALLAVEEINRAGGINGRKLALVIKDDGSSPASSLERARELQTLGLKIIIGPFTSSSAAKTLDFINKNKILTIGPVVAGDQLAEKDDYFIKLYPSSKLFGTELGKLAVSMGLRNPAIITDSNNRVYAEPMAKAFKDQLRKSGAAISTEMEFNSAEKVSYAELIEKILPPRPDAMLIIAGPLHTAMIAQQLRIKGSSIPCMSSSWAANEDLISGGGNAVEGMLMYVPFDRNSTIRAFNDFQKAYENRFSSIPSFCSAFNYEAVKLLAGAIKNSGAVSPEELRTVITDNMPHKGLQENYFIDANGDAQRPLVLQTIKDGKFINVEP
ncbi:ABC transporter substrate-binding protein [Maridesulfovibrio sp. FT414]|uniref:ABC transporter substrate-binding protein n=1 Tax=Maridesulfovibrio sp. FT414 TaxID=2979469 RepID=UPI003D80124A